MLENIEIIKPERIEERSMQMIESEMDPSVLEKFSREELKVVKRCIHTAADFDYQYNLEFINGITDKFKEVLKNAIIVTDTTMAAAGINKKKLRELGSEVRNFIADEEVIKKAKDRGVTRSAICMEIAGRIKKENPDRHVICAVGNAPTALIRLYELHEEKTFIPDMLIASPVGFVNVEESKNLILKTTIPSVVAKGRKGGSNIAAAIINAFIYQM